MKKDYVVTYTDKNPAYSEGRKMWKAVIFIIAFSVITSINF